MKLKFTETIGEQIFRIDDIEEDGPMLQIQAFNEFADLPYKVRREAAFAALNKWMEVASQQADAIRHEAKEGQ